MADPSVSLLSHRAQPYVTTSPGTLIWEILSDQWNPSSNPGGYVSVGVAENRLMHEELREHISKYTHIETAAFTYGDGPRGTHRLREVMSRFLTKHLRPLNPLTPSQLMITNGVSHAIEHCSWALADEDDAFLLGKPYYGAFIPDISLRPGVEVVQVQFADTDPMSVEAVQNYEQAILETRERGVQVKGLMLCSPHNPLGRCYPEAALIAYLRLCQKYQIHLVSDEIYALSIWQNKEDKHPPPVAFTSILSIDVSKYINPALVHVLWGMSKDFGANGLRLGCLISQNNPTFLKSLIPVAIYSYASMISDHVVANILEDDAWTDRYIRTNQQRLSEAYSFVVSLLRKHEIEYTPGANAAFFLWVDLGKAYLNRHPERTNSKDITQEIMDALLKQKVYLASGTVFGSESPGVFRIVFSHPRGYMEEALRRIMRALDVGIEQSLTAKL